MASGEVEIVDGSGCSASEVSRSLSMVSMDS